MEVLKLHFILPVAHWRVSFTQNNIHRSYPLPPPSTVLGMIHKVCGCKEGEKILGIDMAVAGKYEYIFYQYQLFRNLHNPVRHAYKEAHPGGPMPTQVQLLGGVELYIYLRVENNIISNKENEKVLSLEKIKNCFENPSAPFIIGRREDIAILEGFEIIQLKKVSLPFSLQKFSCWVNIKHKSGLRGVTYLIPFYYDKVEIKTKNKKDIIRNFEKIRCIYAEPQMISLINNEVPEGYVDEIVIKKEEKKSNKKEKEEPLKLPVFFLKLNEEKNE